jgi:hypothetical protein
LRLKDGDKTLVAKYRMHAYECDDNVLKPKEDYTAARGEEELVLKVASPRGRILGLTALDKDGTLFDVDTTMSHQYIDTNTSDDVVPFDLPNPVEELHFVGDTKGDEAGTRTGVFIKFRDIRVELETCAPPPPPPAAPPSRR